MSFFGKLFGWVGGCEKSCCASGMEGDFNPAGFVEYVVKSLVDCPEEVSLETEQTADGVVIKVRCRKEDIGKIVGKHGKTIMAIRSLVSGAAGREGRRISVDVLD